MEEKELWKRAVEARAYSYSPYSGFRVGAALLCSDGTVYTGCNIENAAYSPSNCAERTAIFTAVAAGKRQFSAIAIAGGKDELVMCYPCGVCRQVMSEFVRPQELRIICGKDENALQIFTLEKLLPKGFEMQD